MCHDVEVPGRELEIPGTYMLIYIKPKTKANRENMLFALKKIKETYENIVVYTNEIAKEIIVAGMDEKHLANIINKLVNEYGIELTVVKKQAFYKETIKTPVKSEGRYIKQEKYGRCLIEIAPNERDTGSEFINNIQDDEVIPKEYINSIESGIKLAMTKGRLGNFPISDIKVTLYDGSYHYTDSSNMTFKIAGIKAFKDGLAKLETFLLEPLMKIQISVHEKNTDKIIEDIIKRRGEILHKENNNGYNQISAIIPLTEIVDRPQMLFANFEVELLSEKFSHYEEVPEFLKSSILEEHNFNGYEYFDLNELLEEEEKILREIKWCENYRNTHPNERTTSGKDSILGECGSAYIKLSQIRNPVDNILTALKSFNETSKIYKLRGDKWRYALKQIEIGNAYIKLSECIDCMENLIKAKEVFNEVLIITKDVKGCSLQYEEALYYLGYTCVELFKIDNSRNNFKEAISLFDKLLKEGETNSFRDILRYTNIMNIGKAYAMSAKVNNRDDYFLRAINIFKEILNSKNLKNPSLDYLNAQCNLGNVYYQLSTMVNSEKNLLSAIACFKEALQIEKVPSLYPFKEEKPLDYAKIQYNLGRVYFMLSKIKDNEENLLYATESFNKALWGYFEALKINKIEKYPLYYAEINKKVGRTYMSLFKIHCCEENYLKAMKHFKEAVRVYDKEKCTLNYNSLEEYNFVL